MLNNKTNNMEPIFRPFVSTVRTYWMFFIATVVFSFLSQVHAQTSNPQVGDGGNAEIQSTNLLTQLAPRIWVLNNGKTVSGYYYSAGTTNLWIKSAGYDFQLDINYLSPNDKSYVARMAAWERQSPKTFADYERQVRMKPVPMTDKIGAQPASDANGNDSATHRTWVLKNGKRVTGDFITSAFVSAGPAIFLNTNPGKLTLPLADLSDNDKTYLSDTLHAPFCIQTHPPVAAARQQYPAQPAMARTPIPAMNPYAANGVFSRRYNMKGNFLLKLAIECLLFAGALFLRCFRLYRKQPAEGQKITGYGNFSMAYITKHRVWILIGAVGWLILATVLLPQLADLLSMVGTVIGTLLCIGIPIAFILVLTRFSPEGRAKKKLKQENYDDERQFNECKARSDMERRQWFESLGATHTERVKTINEIFDRKDKTIGCSIRFEKKAGEEYFQIGHNERYQSLYFEFSRHLASMETREREFLRAVELLHSISDRNEKDENWYNWAKSGLIWGDGKATVNYQAWRILWLGGQGNFKDASSAIKWDMERRGQSVDKIVNEVLQKVEKLKSEQAQHPELGPLIKSINARLKGGNAWLSAEDVSKTPFAPQNNFALRIGLLDDSEQELSYSGEGSLISIAPPGSGKTQCNVFPNLLTWRGPAVVLDVKGEIYAKTSKWRAENVGPVFKFSPLDPAKSHCYNPLSFVRQETDFIWEDSRFIADMMIVPSGGTDPFWENKARDVLTAAIAYVCYSNTADQRPMSRITDIIHGGKPWEEMVLGLQTAVDVRSMMQQGTSLGEMNEKTRDSVLQTAQSSLSAWSGERISRVTQKSDWSPLDLRSGRNPTIYVCLKPSEVDSYISLLRVFIAQHIRMLTNELPPHGYSPILFLLDELPRLKQMPPVEEAIEIGRQYGIRLWMFAQSLGQLEQAYPNAEGIVGSCAVRIFMNPSSHDGTADKLSEELGFRESALDGSRLKVVEAAD